MYKIKSLDYYSNIIRISNREEKFMTLWHDEFAPANYIGHVNSLLEKYSIKEYFESCGSTENTLTYYIESYLQDSNELFTYEKAKNNQGNFFNNGRNEEQLKDIVRHLMSRCNELGVNAFGNKLITEEMLLDIIIGHTCYETVMGYITELRVRKYLAYKGYNLKNGLTRKAEDILDSYGCDIPVSDKEGKIVFFIQVKPLSFLFGKNGRCREDRSKCYENEELLRAYTERHKNWFSDNIDNNIRYIVYDKNRKYNFILFDLGGRERLFIKVGDFTNRDGEILLDYQRVTKSQTTDLMEV